MHSNENAVPVVVRDHFLRFCFFLLVQCDILQGGPKKRGHRLMTIILSILNRFKKRFHWKIPW